MNMNKKWGHPIYSILPTITLHIYNLKIITNQIKNISHSKTQAWQTIFKRVTCQIIRLSIKI